MVRYDEVLDGEVLYDEVLYGEVMDDERVLFGVSDSFSSSAH